MVQVTYLPPGFALLWGALFLQEDITLTAILGLTLILLGIGITSGQLSKTYQLQILKRRIS
jgi:drug/metabolite transporter (DMT)-like permease